MSDRGELGIEYKILQISDVFVQTIYQDTIS